MAFSTSNDAIWCCQPILPNDTHVLATADDDVLGPVGEVDKSILVNQSHVTSVKPAILVEYLGSSLGVVDVALHDVGSASKKNTRLAGRHLFPGLGVDDLDAADRNDWADGGGSLDVVLADDRAVRGICLCHSPALAYHCSGESLFDVSYESLGGRSTTITDRCELVVLW